MPELDFPARASAWGRWNGLAAVGFSARPVEGEALCVIAPRKGKTAQTHAALQAQFGAAPPTSLGCISSNSAVLIAHTPESALLITSDAPSDLAAGLRTRLEGLASVSDQSGAYARLTLAGAGARAVLQKGVFIDLHADAFKSGSALTTHIAHIGALLWHPNSEERFDLAIFRSYATDFIHWLERAARLNPPNAAEASAVSPGG